MGKKKNRDGDSGMKTEGASSLLLAQVNDELGGETGGEKRQQGVRKVVNDVRAGRGTQSGNAKDSGPFKKKNHTGQP